MWAAGKGSDDVLRTMLSLKSDIDINMADKYGGTGKNWETCSICFLQGSKVYRCPTSCTVMPEIIVPNLILFDFHWHILSLGYQDITPKVLFPPSLMAQISLCFYQVNGGIWFKSLVAP